MTVDVDYHDGEDGGEQLHVLDLPQLYTKPSAEALIDTLALLSYQPFSWDSKIGAARLTTKQVNPEGVTKYLTSIIASQLAWIKDEETKEQIWELASVRLCERSGRTAMPAVTRSFTIPTNNGGSEAEIVLYEPSLTADNLGFKTWASSFLLSKRLHLLDIIAKDAQQAGPILELGAGTGLVGMAAATVWGAHVHLTDLPEIVENLSRNAETNRARIAEHGGSVSTGVLDWTHYSGVEGVPSTGRYSIILAADPIYSPDHPRLFVQTVRAWLSTDKNARVVVELPFRDAYAPQIQELKDRLADIGLGLKDQGEEVGYDDWGGRDGRPAEVRCWWGVWGW
ncbi:putative glucose-inducible SAM-dependent methyltransferase Rrg1 [Xylona heveae TC161]|uniref:Putative glucose-inducible SAM-dependent methyltransferase Rrg1 n=1 Tax=Xylona heveae (strain CBS 132557 / TC161) TaxID=1328760 RepID=A0A165GC43_XYLHT|nr:putative glucose-inducible SAM-dependent methyltransferase Rrg1 [Xylona heveae TC161]KZF22012.1 putative glucose-inducible SAM-dependent methyltransferase Rrg1 [Xylona heveae TC161]